MADFSDTLGLGTLPSARGADAMDAALGGGGGGLDVPLTPRASAVPAPPSGVDLSQMLGMLRPQQPQGALGPNSQFMAALGAGLNAAGQNWNKPALAAFASGAGAALQGGQQWSHQQQDGRLKALHAAIAAWKAGDIAGYHQALALFRALAAPAAGPTR
jgi:hypothetical protein